VARNIPESSARFVVHFHEYGWVRIHGAFDAEAARAMRDSVWRALGNVGICRDRPSTWTVERPPHLQHLKDDPVFQRVGSPTLLSAIDAILDGVPYEKPRNWGALFLAFPGSTPWRIPTSGWHIDAYYASPLLPMRSVKTLALFGDIVPRGGGTLMVSGSHRLAYKWFQENPPSRGARSAQMRRLLQKQPYVRDLHSPGDDEERIQRFMRYAQDVDGIPLQVVEATGDAGDVILVHPLVMHVAAPNNAPEPRLMVSGGVTTDMWGWRPKTDAC
jgi:Phytanoyl-CoA dioxygenase (PhyH)